MVFFDKIFLVINNLYFHPSFSEFHNIYFLNNLQSLICLKQGKTKYFKLVILLYPLNYSHKQLRLTQQPTYMSQF